MKKLVFAITIAMLLASCQTSPTKLWVASLSTDRFTDVQTKMVTVGSFQSGGALYTQTGKYYPFVGNKNGLIYVGIRSGGSYRIPTGTVQIRIDENTAWTITPEETPVDLVPGTAPAATAAAGVPQEMMASMSKMLSPYTATTGKKARDIIKEMAAGKVIRYRTVGLNQAASTTGEVQIDASFIEAIQSIGISIN